MSRVAVAVMAGVLMLAQVPARAQEPASEEAQFRAMLGDLLAARIAELEAEGTVVEPLPSHPQLWVGALEVGEEGGVAEETVTFPGGEGYLLMAVCDGDCYDIDLLLYPPGDRSEPFDSDTEDDAEPVLVPGLFDDGGLPGGDYTVELRMYDCRSDYCYFAVGVYRFDEE